MVAFKFLKKPAFSTNFRGNLFNRSMGVTSVLFGH